MKNAGHIAGKTVFTFGIASLVFWAVGYGLIYGEGNGLLVSLISFMVMTMERDFLVPLTLYSS